MHAKPGAVVAAEAQGAAEGAAPSVGCAAARLQVSPVGSRHTHSVAHVVLSWVSGALAQQERPQAWASRDAESVTTTGGTRFSDTDGGASRFDGTADLATARSFDATDLSGRRYDGPEATGVTDDGFGEYEEGEEEAEDVGHKVSAPVASGPS